MASGRRSGLFALSRSQESRRDLPLPSLRWPEEDERDRILAERALRFWLWAAAAVRLWQVVEEPAVLHPDAFGQALEPAFRAAFGHGDVAWEWREGLRSWAWPLLLSPAFWLARGLGAPEVGLGMAPFVGLARGVAVAMDLATLALAVRLEAALAAGDWRFGDGWMEALARGAMQFTGRRSRAAQVDSGRLEPTAGLADGLTRSGDVRHLTTADDTHAEWAEEGDARGDARHLTEESAEGAAGDFSAGARNFTAPHASALDFHAPAMTSDRSPTPRGARHLTVHVVGALGALHPVWAVTGSQTLIDVPAAAVLLVAAHLTLSPTARPFALGVALAAATLVRIQLAPALGLLAATALLRHIRADVPPASPSALPSPAWMASRTPWQRLDTAMGVGFARRMGLGAVVGALPFAVLDLLTVGAPFEPLVRYVLFNAEAGQTAFGVMEVDHYLRHAHAALPYLLPALAGLALIGARHQPALGLAMAAFLIAHQALPYRVFRFLHPGLWLVLVLAAIGAAHAAAALRHGLGDQARPPVRTRIALGGVALAGLMATAEAWRDDAIWQTTWLWHHGGHEAVERSRALNRAALAMSAEPPARVLVQAVLPAAAAPGHVLFGHDVQLRHPLGRSMSAAQIRSADAWILASDDLPALGPGARTCRAT